MPIRTLSLFPLLLIGSAPALMAAPRHCLPYGPIQVTLSGTLAPHAGAAVPAVAHAHAHVHTHVPAGAAAAQEEILILPQRLCVAASADGRQARHEDVRRLRLAVTADQAAHLREGGDGQIVRVTGTLAEVAAGEGEPALRLTVLGVDSD